MATRAYSRDWNQPPELVPYNPWLVDRALREAVAREQGAWIEPRAHDLGALVGSERMQQLADAANRNVPQLRTHDRHGRRLDAVEFHPAYHELMSLAFGAGLHSLAWTSTRDGAFVARAALNFLWNQGENGTSCPVTMSFAAVHVLRQNGLLARDWEPKLLACDYDPRPLPVASKRAVTIGMAMTERQGGSDLRAVATRAKRADGAFVLEGHKWFCSVPMSDAFFTLALTDGGMSCFFVPRSLHDGRRNPFFLQRLKDKCGNRSNASAEIELHGTHAILVGDEGRGIATLIGMAHLTRFDIVIAAAGMTRALVTHALHHARHREAFGKRLSEQALMRNVLADLALESEAATLLAFRLAGAFDRSESQERERHFSRIATPVAKYWLCKRLPMIAAEAMECLGGNGYVEEAPLARLYREAPLNGIWEGSGNVICLDVLRSVRRDSTSAQALICEVAAGGEATRAHTAALQDILARGEQSETEARRVVEAAALGLQASLMARHAPAPSADAFIASRRDGSGRHFGILPEATRFDAILERALPG